MDIVVHQSINEIDSKQWNAMLRSNNPFMRHEFLNGLETCGCVSSKKGWDASHIAIYDTPNKQTLIAAMPCYIKHHSYGEYIFDWSWADAYHRHGQQYYPKLSNAIPFTPATGERWLCHNSHDTEKLSNLLIEHALKLVKKHNLSSFHSLFVNSQQFRLLGKHELLQRHSSQFHWVNKNYQSFDDFLSLMSSKKRKNIKRERRRVVESEITYRWLSGEQLDSQASQTMYQFYSRTIEYYGAQSYLNKSFFDYLTAKFNEQTLFLFAYHEEQIIAGGLYFKSNDTLYGRYWGALANFHSVHFETCYYQAIEWCINNGYSKFEAGAQGEHKLARGLEPTTTYSAHWINHPDFHHPIADFIKHEQDHIENYEQTMQSHSPFKHEL